MVLNAPNKSFESVIIHYADKGGKLHKVFSPSHFLRDITSKRLPNYRPYFLSHGMQNRNGKTVANFEIVYQEEEEDFDIFDHKEEAN